MSSYDSTEVAIQTMLEAAQRMIITVNSQGTAGEERREEGLGINPAMNRHFELEIERYCKMLQEMKIS